MYNRVFVSSTFTDLAEYRQAVESAVRQLEAIDVSMEHFGARDERPKDECLRLIREESDVFVGIYAHGYGFIPDDSEISITEAEYDEATSAGLPRLIYLLEPSTPWIPDLIDTGDVADRIDALKNKLKSNHICEFFANKDQLAARVAADLDRYFSKRDSTAAEVAAASIGPEREERLIQQLRSADKYKIKRSIQALAPSQNPWLVDALTRCGSGNESSNVCIGVFP